MKKLIPALCMLLVAACLMGTSTYAWFAANKAVTASGMQVKAAADGGLAIASYVKDATTNDAVAPASTAFAASATAQWSNQLDADGKVRTDATVKPTSTWNGAWVTANSQDANKSKDDSTTYAPIAEDALSAYAQQTTWAIKSLDQTSQKYVLKVTAVELDGVTETASSQALNNALRVAICVNGTDWFYFAPLTDATDEKTLAYVETTKTDDASTADVNEFAAESKKYAAKGITLDRKSTRLELQSR